MNEIQAEVEFEMDMKTTVQGTDNQQVRARWKQGYRTGRRSACADLALAIEHDVELRKQISAAVDPFEFLAQWIKDFTKDIK